MVAVEVESAGEDGGFEWRTAEDDGTKGGDIAVEDGVGLAARAAGDLEVTAADFGLEAVVAEALLVATVKTRGSHGLEGRFERQDKGVDAELGGGGERD